MTGNAILALFLAALLFAPLAFGAVESWSLGIVEAGVFAALAALLLREYRSTGGTLRRVPGSTPYLLFLVFILLQILPLPQPLLGLLSPETLRLYSQAGVAGDGRWLPLTLNVKATFGELLRFAACGAAYWITVQLLADGRRLDRAMRVVALFAVLYALAAVLQGILPGNFLLDFRGLPENAHPFGTYVNRNHYAALAAMLLHVLLALFFLQRRSSGGAGFRNRLAAIFNSAGSPGSLALGFSVVLMIASVVLSRSRGGMVVTALGLVILGAILLWRGRGGLALPAAVTAVVLALLFIGPYGMEPAVERFEHLQGRDGGINLLRLTYWRDIAALGADFPVAGTGLGTFVDIYPKYRSIRGTSILRHAHNDYLETFATAGAAGSLLLLLFVAVVLRYSFRNLARRRRSRPVFLAAGGLAGAAAFLIHGCFDFNLQVGANALFFFFLLGLAVAAASSGNGGEGEAMPSLSAAGSPAKGLPAAVAALVLLIASLLFNGGLFAAAREASPERAALFDPLEADHRRRIAEEAWAAGRLEEALEAAAAAIALAPTRSVSLQRYGMLLAEAGRDGEAGRFLRLGAAWDRQDPVRREVLAGWLFSRGEMNEALDVMGEAIVLDPRSTGEQITVMVLYGIEAERIAEAIPPLTKPLLQFGDFLAATGRHGMAVKVYGEALAVETGKDHPDPGPVHKVARYHAARGRTGEALEILEEGISVFPRSATLRLTAAALYERTGDRSRAAGEYRAALAIDPGSVNARRGLERTDSR